MDCVFSKTLDLPNEEAVAKTREALGTEGFGVITGVDLQKTLQTKIGVDFRR